jgi:hypothetical protein
MYSEGDENKLYQKNEMKVLEIQNRNRKMSYTCLLASTTS